jgi:TolB-like protein/DNA-binding winged helix-turn-helix (wHTH) protein/tetratricopeptide (TPR) repeat protein
MRDAPEPVGLTPPREAESFLRFAGLVLDLEACTLARESGEVIPLTRGEFAVLRIFAARPGRVLSRDTLLDAIANRRFEPFDRSVDVLVGRLRRKIEPDPKQPRLIVTVPGEGYRFDGLTKPRTPDRVASTAVPEGEQDGRRLAPASETPAPSEQAEVAATSRRTWASGPIAGSEPQNGGAAKSRESALRPGLARLVAAIAALLLLMMAGWFLLDGSLTRSAQAVHLSIVALPFANLSGDPAQDHLADGITDNLITELSRIKGSFVIARHTALTYKGKNVGAKQIGRELGVRYVVEGSTEGEQGRVRVNAQLIDAESEAHLWADRFEGEAADSFRLQDDVVTRLAHGLNLALIEAEADKGAHATNPDAVDLTMRGTEALIRSLPQSEQDMRKVNAEARASFERALEIDPNDADALAGSAATYLREFAFGWGDPGTDCEAKVLGQANRAIAIDSNTMGAYQVKADYLNASGRPRGALSVADAGLAINPDSVSLFWPRACAENILGRFDQAKADAELAIRLSPRDPFLGMFHLIVGDAEINLGRFDAAIEAYRRALVAGKRDLFVYTNLAAAYALAEKMDEAEAALAEARRLNPQLTVSWMLRHVHAYPPVLDGVRKAGLPEE